MQSSEIKCRNTAFSEFRVKYTATAYNIAYKGTVTEQVCLPKVNY